MLPYFRNSSEAMTKTVFISGASSGFGQATARQFGNAGDRLILCARRRDRLQALQKELRDQCESLVLEMDLTNADKVAQVTSELPADFREIDLLVNNAGLALGLEPAHRASLSDWDTMVDTNIKGLYHLTRALLPDMVDRNRGHIINIGSIAGNYAYPGGNTYGATKAFVKQFTRNLRADLLGTRIRVTNIEPGLAETEFSLVRFGGDAGKAGQVYQGTDPLRPEDIAEAVFWAANQPERVNVNSIELMPTCQAWAALAIDKVQG